MADNFNSPAPHALEVQRTFVPESERQEFKTNLRELRDKWRLGHIDANTLNIEMGILITEAMGMGVITPEMAQQMVESHKTSIVAAQSAYAQRRDVEIRAKGKVPAAIAAFEQAARDKGKDKTEDMVAIEVDYEETY